MRANDMQVGGSHYNKGQIQHWDVIDRNGIGYLEGVATKYVCRHKEKGGLQDLRKAEHYVLKLIEEIEEHGRRPRGTALSEEIQALRVAHQLNDTEYGFVFHLLAWNNIIGVRLALKDLRDLIMWAEQQASPQS
jgi:hypothetical protein